MAEFPALPLWTDAYLGDTTHLTTIEHGAYLLLLMTAWRSRDCSLPDDDRLLSRYARLNAQQWKRIRPILEQFFTVEAGAWVQKRLSDERGFVQRVRQKQSDKGKLSARAKALKTNGRHSTTVKPGCDVVATAGQPDFNLPSPSPSTLDKESNGEIADSDQVFWTNAKSFISGEVKGDPGSLIGKWIREFGREPAAQAITRAQLERPVQRIPFIVGCLKQSGEQEGRLSVPC